LLIAVVVDVCLFVVSVLCVVLCLLFVVVGCCGCCNGSGGGVVVVVVWLFVVCVVVAAAAADAAAGVFNETGCPQRRAVVRRHVAGDAADFQSVTVSTVPARGNQECLISSIEFNDSHVSGLVGCAPLLSCYDFHGLARMRVIHGDGNIYINL